MKVKIKLHNENCMPEMYGNLIDLKSSIHKEFYPPIIEDKELLNIKFNTELIPLGVSIKLPKYFRANLYLRSSIGSKKELFIPNGEGIIDGDSNLTENIKGIEVDKKANKGYNGETDQWMLPLIATKRTTINEGERIAQFEIIPTMDCPWWIKLRYFFNNKIKFEFVDTMLSSNRDGLGSSNKLIKI